MRVTDDRYRAEQSKFQLALRMIRHEARTGTIRYWTGLSDDRIRKLYASYFKFSDLPVKRRRGKSPMQVSPLVQSPGRALESGLCANLMLANGLVSTEQPPGPRLRHNIDLGHRFCQCFEYYRRLIDKPTFSFEWTWNLLVSIRRGDELGIARCCDCGICYVCDLLAIPKSACPTCRTVAGRTVREELH